MIKRFSYSSAEPMFGARYRPYSKEKYDIMVSTGGVFAKIPDE